MECASGGWACPQYPIAGMDAAALQQVSKANPPRLTSNRLYFKIRDAYSVASTLMPPYACFRSCGLPGTQQENARLNS